MANLELAVQTLKSIWCGCPQLPITWSGQDRLHEKAEPKQLFFKVPPEWFGIAWRIWRVTFDA